MPTRHVPASAPDRASVERAGRILRAGGLVAFPTETVYGLGAAALDPAAVARVFAAKGRPADNPLIVHVAEPEDLGTVAAEVTPLAVALVARWWPGPLTVVLRARPEVPQETTGGLATVAVRMPDHAVALAVIRAAGVPIAAPSANRSGRPSPTTAAHVRADLHDAIDLILDGGPCRVGVESTVVDARGELPVILREGGVTREDLGIAAGAAPGEITASPGTRLPHYQPTCAVVLAAPGEAAAVAAAQRRRGLTVGLVSPAAAPSGVVQIARLEGSAALAAGLYDALRAAEVAAVDVVVIETVAEQGIGRAVMDRLRRAAGAGAG